MTRVFSIASYLITLAFRSRSEWTQLLRSLGANILDDQFARMSPLPLLPATLSRVLRQEEVILPPLVLFHPGNQDLRGLIYLVSLAKALNAQSIFEIGTYNGVTSLTLANNLPQATVHTVDLPPDQGPVLPISATDNRHLNRFFNRVYEGRVEAQRIVQHLSDSAKFDFSPFSKCCQLVYVDGAHSFEYVANDTTAAFEIVSELGAIVWDDYWRYVPGVSRYLHSLKMGNIFRLPESRLVVWLSDKALAYLDRQITLERSEGGI